MKISLDLLLILDAIDRRGSFTAAAAALHRVPSALSHAVAKMESDLGITLFLREGRKATLNEAGRTLLDDGRHLLRAASELERRVQRVADGWEAELRIAIDAVIPIERVFPLLKRFYAAGCGTQIRLSGEVLGGTWDALTTGRADLAIGAPGDPPSRSGIATRMLSAHTDFIFAIAPDHPRQTRRTGSRTGHRPCTTLAGRAGNCRRTTGQKGARRPPLKISAAYCLANPAKRKSAPVVH